MDQQANRLTDAGLDRIALDPDWGDLPQRYMPIDVVQQANSGAEIRRPTSADLEIFAAAKQRRRRVVI
jgi:hypothetical protein